MGATERCVTVMLDGVGYAEKPSAHVPEITNRLKRSEPQTLTVLDFAQAIANGRTWCGGCFERDPSKKFGESRFMGQQLFGLDFDNDTELLDEYGNKVKDESGHIIKRSLMPDESGYLDPWEARIRWARLFHADPLIMYPSMSFSFDGSIRGRWNPETKMKYRLVLDVGQLITDQAEARGVIKRLMAAFPECDPKCSNPNRLYFGSGGTVLLTTEDTARYVKRST